MLLTCPTCRSGLEVPEGTTALVRCPACKTVFSPADGAPPAAGEGARPRTRPRAAREREEDEEGDEPKGGNRDFDPLDEEEEARRKRRRRSPGYAALDPEEKAARRAAFQRAAWGARLIWISFALFMISMGFVLVYFFQSAFTQPRPVFVTLAGALGMLNWLLAAVGIGLCLSGPPAPGHLGYGVAAAVATLFHLVFLLVLVAQGREVAFGKVEDGSESARWALIPTRLNATMFYLTAVVYPETQGITPKGPMVLSMIVGIAEMVRTVLIMMFLSCLARAALDEGLAHKCTRAAGIASVGPGLLALVIFGFVAGVIETNAGVNMFTLVLFATVNMGVYSIVNAVIFPCFLTAREVDDACEEPFQSLIPNL